jgi:hypothetical protein
MAAKGNVAGEHHGTGDSAAEGGKPGTACRRCGHPRGSHQPYIPGSHRPGYCAGSACGCWQYRRPRPWARFLAWWRWRPPPVTPAVLHQRPVPFPVPAREWYDDTTRLDVRPARPYTGQEPWR